MGASTIRGGPRRRSARPGEVGWRDAVQPEPEPEPERRAAAAAKG